jgi:hypothetical protein
MQLLQIFHETLGFPCDKTVMPRKQTDLESIGLGPHLFDGTIDNAMKVMHLLLSIGYDGRVVLAVDAASVTPKITVSATGKVAGLVGIQGIDSDGPLSIHQDDAMPSLFPQNRDLIIRAEFTILLAPLDPGHPRFPIYSFPASSGSGSHEFISNLEFLGLFD